jgi:hypothetical protein
VWDLTVMTLVGIVITALALGTLGVVAVLLVGTLLFVVASMASTTITWPNAEVVEMRAKVEQILPPPPMAAFVTASIKTHFDGDRWRCVEYETETSPPDTHAYYERAKHLMRWGANDGSGFDGPYLVQQALVARDVTITVTPWIEGAPGVPGAFVTAVHLWRVSVCYSYETWAWPETHFWPMRTRRPIMITHWPDPDVVAMRERVESAYPPDPAWTFSGATLTRHPDGWRRICIAYDTGISADDTRAYYERAWRTAQLSTKAGMPLLGKASVKASDGAVTLCPL